MREVTRSAAMREALKETLMELPLTYEPARHFFAIVNGVRARAAKAGLGATTDIEVLDALWVSYPDMYQATAQMLIEKYVEVARRESQVEELLEMMGDAGRLEPWEAQYAARPPGERGDAGWQRRLYDAVLATDPLGDEGPCLEHEECNMEPCSLEDEPVLAASGLRGVDMRTVADRLHSLCGALDFSRYCAVPIDYAATERRVFEELAQADEGYSEMDVAELLHDLLAEADGDTLELSRTPAVFIHVRSQECDDVHGVRVAFEDGSAFELAVRRVVRPRRQGG